MSGLLTVVMASSMAGILAFGQETPAPSGKTLEQAHEWVEQHQLDKANALLSDAVRHDPGNETALVELGRVQLAQGLNEDALKSFETVLGDRPNSAPAREGEVKAAIAVALADRQAGINDSGRTLSGSQEIVGR